MLLSIWNIRHMDTLECTALFPLVIIRRNRIPICISLNTQWYIHCYLQGIWRMKMNKKERWITFNADSFIFASRWNFLPIFSFHKSNNIMNICLMIILYLARKLFHENKIFSQLIIFCPIINFIVLLLMILENKRSNSARL